MQGRRPAGNSPRTEPRSSRPFGGRLPAPFFLLQRPLLSCDADVRINLSDALPIEASIIENNAIDAVECEAGGL